MSLIKRLRRKNDEFQFSQTKITNLTKDFKHIQ